MPEKVPKHLHQQADEHAGRHQGPEGGVQGALICPRPFRPGMAPTVIAYNEVYNAIQNNVI